MRNIFNSVKLPKIGSNVFDLKHDHKTTFNMGELVPTMLIDTLPGDKFEISVENMLRLAPLVSPVMHRINVTTHCFFVPNRLIWDEWEDFITGKTTPVPPYCNNLTSMTTSSLGNYMGIPLTIDVAGTGVSCLPLAAYLLIYDEYYRDQNLQVTKSYIDVVAGDNTQYDAIATGALKKRAWMHDYFTAALPTAQAGSVVSLPLTDVDKVDVTLKSTTGIIPEIKDSDTHAVVNNAALGTAAAAGKLEDTGTSNPVVFDPAGSLEVDVNADATDINTLRRAFRLQEFLERSIRGGQRYIETIWSHFNTKSSDARLQRPEYIGGQRQKMIISEVLSTAETVDSADATLVNVGMMAGHGISVGGGNKFRYKCEEHGFIIAITSVTPVTGYQDGIERKWLRLVDYLDYAWPSFANIGEQEVMNQEVYAAGGTATRQGTFGYVPRYAEYKYSNNRVSGKFQTDLAYWHLGRIFTSAPALNAAFVECDPDTRIFADETGDHIFAHIFNNVKAIRKLPKYGIPTI